ncbi:hypothetical protein INT45_000867 [Circinella minor]|uniref:Uncharacterized protein n=1 Tax=Circinella minor TaxID=1195481 RepID=A0A8H7S652_9FUNG|nr:hypothetical protein INT45_000867 [Circinella minor]
MQQTMSSRFRDSSHGPIQNLNDKRSTVAFSPSDHLDGIFQAVRHQVERWGENAKWKIELILLTDQQQQQQQSTTSKYHPHHYGITRSNNRSETWNIPYAADLQQNSLRNAMDRIKYLENIIKTQEERLKQLKTNNFIQTLEMIHSTTVKELKEQHRIEIKLLQKENQTLAKKFMRISSTLQKIERIGLSFNDKDTQQLLDKKQLIEDHKILTRKLHLNELRLRARDAELNYLRNLIWTYRHSMNNSEEEEEEEEDDQEDNNNDHDDKSTENDSLLTKKQNNDNDLLQQQQQQQQQSKKRPISALDSLSILADQMLNDPDFGSEDKKSLVSMDSKSLLLNKKKVGTNASICIKKEIMENHHTTATVANNNNNNKRKRKEQQQSSLEYYHYRNIKQGVVNEHRIMDGNNNNDNLIRPSSAFHTITRIHHPYTPSNKHYQQKQQNRYYTSPPVNIIPRPSPTKDQESFSTANNVNLLSPSSSSFNSPLFMSPVPSSSSNAYQHSHYSRQQQQQQQQQSDPYYSSNKKQRWSVNISNKKTD